MFKENVNCNKIEKNNSCHNKTHYYVGPPGPPGPQGPTGPFLSCYLEALGDGQVIATNDNIVFDVDSVDSVGNGITLSQDGKVFTINRTGLYIVEWNVNLTENSVGDVNAVIGLIENGEPTSGSYSRNFGNFSSGALIYVDTVPYTISLHNFNSETSIENPMQWENTAASIRIARFADGPII